jgi:ribonuclease D
MSVDLSAAAIEARLRRASALVDSLSAESRLDTKIDLSREGVERRLKEASDLLDLCNALRAAGAARQLR